MGKRIRLLIVDDHILFRKGLVELFNYQPDFEIAAEAANGVEALEIYKHQSFDVIILDLRMPRMDGLETLKKIRANADLIPVLILSISDDPQDVISAVLAGGDGYILKSEDFEVLTEAIKAVYQGKKAISKQLIEILFLGIQEKHHFPVEGLLSKRELEVLVYLSQGKLIDEIAEKLFVSENTIKTHLKHIYKKLTVNNRTEAVKKGILWGLIKE